MGEQSSFYEMARVSKLREHPLAHERNILKNTNTNLVMNTQFHFNKMACMYFESKKTTLTHCQGGVCLKHLPVK